MWWLVISAAVGLGICFLAGIVPEDQGLSLARCWDRAKYAVSMPEWALAVVTGVFLVIVLYVLNGMLRLLTMAVGTLTIVTGGFAEWIGERLPPYPIGSGKYKEVEE